MPRGRLVAQRGPTLWLARPYTRKESRARGAYRTRCLSPVALLELLSAFAEAGIVAAWLGLSGRKLLEGKAGL